MAKILVVEDDVDVGNAVEEILSGSYEVARAYSGTEALLCAKMEAPDLVLLDLMLPGLSGEEALPKLLPLPVIIVSAKPDPEEKAELLFLGACDYITKPFYPKELLARVAAQLRRPAAEAAAARTYGGVSLDADTHTVRGPGGTDKLTRTESALLKLFMSDPGRVFAKSVILDRISLDTPDCTESSLKMHISNLRKKLRGIGAEDYIESVWGIGFKLRDA